MMALQLSADYWLAMALATPKPRLPIVRRIDDPIRTLHDAARAVALNRAIEARSRAKVACENYGQQVSDWRENLRLSATF